MWLSTYWMTLSDGIVILFLWADCWHLQGEDAHIGPGWPGELFMSQINNAAKKEAHPSHSQLVLCPEASRGKWDRAFREHSGSPSGTIWAEGFRKLASISQPVENPPRSGGRSFAHPIYTTWKSQARFFLQGTMNMPLYPQEWPCWVRNFIGKIKHPLTAAMHQIGLSE